MSIEIKVNGKIVYNGESGDVEIKPKTFLEKTRDFIFGNKNIFETKATTINGNKQTSSSYRIGGANIVVEINGNVEGNIDTIGTVKCGDVGGNISTVGRVECGNVIGSVSTVGPVNAGSVMGDIDTIGKVTVKSRGQDK